MASGQSSALVAETRAAERRNGSGRVHAPRLKGPDEGQSQGGGRGLPPEPEPQGGVVTDGYVAAPAPPLAVPLLASGRRSRRPLHLPVPPHARHRDEEGLGGGGEEEEGAGVGRTAPRQGPCWRASLCRRAWGLVRDLLSLHREEEEEEKEKEEKVP